MDASAEVLKKLFGRPVRVHLAMWILRQGGSFYLQEAQFALQQQGGHAPSATRGEVQTLRECGLLIETPVAGRKYYTPTASPWWGAFEAISAVAEGTFVPNDSLRAD